MITQKHLPPLKSARAWTGASAAAFFALLVAVFLPPLYKGFSRDLSWIFALRPLPAAAVGASPLYREDFVQGEELTRSVHCPSLVDLHDGSLLAFWYGGTREGASDVALYQATWSGRDRKWTSACPLTDSAHARIDLDRYIRKIGNAVPYRDARGRIWLFYVTVSLGGWSGSSINYMVSEDDGCTWRQAKRLVTSPILNMGTLVRSAPVEYSDGSIGLPVYSELCGKRGELLRLATDGTILDKIWITRDRTFLQPSVVPLDTTRAISFLRNSGEESRRIFRSDSGDGGRSWSAPWRMTLPNPDSAVIGLKARDGELLLVFNNMVIDRDDLSLALSTDEGRSWKIVHEFEKGMPPEGEDIEGFSYPFLIQSDDGLFHLLYSWNRKRIKHVYFNEAWLRSMI
ncbi:MAG: exo-alpha-sialidase [Candidatus Aureabacteria bacterium]|nr:exo-alpha-sialidase [Candidatus Auribacterota bacterium]